MRSLAEHYAMAPNREESLTLEVLAAIEARNDLTQRHLADRLGVALGLANSYLKRCVRKGLVKIQQAPANRYLYYLTPSGLAEKSRLTAEYLAASFDFYRNASASIVAAFEQCPPATRVVFVGVSELAEIASVRSHDFPLEVMGTFAPGYPRDTYLGRPVWRALEAAPAFDIALLCALTDAQPLWQSACDSGHVVIVPSIVQPLLPTPPIAAT